MVHCSIGISYQTTTDATEYRDTERGSGDRNEVRSFTHWRKCSWDELDSSIVGKLDTSVARYKEG